MIPLKDINPSRRTPVVTILIILACSLVFLYEVSLGNLFPVFIRMFGVIPYEVVHGVDIPPPDPLTPYGNLIAHQYIHGGFLHILGNLLFLWIFGDNVEDRFGRLRFLIFYSLCGVVAALTQVFAASSSTLPLIGASGAISGVLGAYMLLFPDARIVTLIFLGFFIDIIAIRAYIWIIIWFIIQFFNALATYNASALGGVAWFAHLGGFLTGILLTGFFLPRKHAR